MYILAAIIAFGVLILIHELGHFILAKLNGVKVEEFAIGMGPKLASISGKETQYSIRILPIGGYVKMLGDEESSDDPRAFNNKSPVRRLSIVIAGPLMNLILAVCIYIVIGMMAGIELPVVNSVVKGSPAEKIGIQKGSELYKINGARILTWDDFVVYVSLAKDKPINLSIKNDGVVKDYNIKPMKNKETGTYMVGVGGKVLTSPNIFQSIEYGFKQTLTMVRESFLSYKLLFTRQASLNDVGGPVTIVKLTRKAAMAGLVPYLNVLALLSASIGILNLVPFPALDGSYVLVCLYEIISGKKANENKIGIINTIGFTILMAFMILIIFKDIVYPINF